MEIANHQANDSRRRDLLKCMAWAGAGVVWSLSAGTPRGEILAGTGAQSATSRFSFVQISDSHIGFAKPANPDARASYKEAVAKIRAMTVRPDFIIHTGDITQLSRPEEFDDADQIIREAGLPVFHTPGEHDMLDEGGGQAFLARYGHNTLGAGWYSFDHGGVHFIALVNVANLKAGGLGALGAEQLTWLTEDLRGRSASTPLVVFAHIPLWSIYPDWGWGTDDAGQALSAMARFGSVTILNGHIHQVMQKVEGDMAFHTARSTAFPQPAPGQGAGPGPLKVPSEQLRGMLGVRQVDFIRGERHLAVIDTPLSA